MLFLRWKILVLKLCCYCLEDFVPPAVKLFFYNGVHKMDSMKLLHLVSYRFFFFSFVVNISLTYAVGSVSGLMVIVVGNGYGETVSNPGQD